MAVDSLQLVFEAAYLHARRLFGMKLSQSETNRLGLLSAMLAGEGRRRFLRLRADCQGMLAHGGGQLSARVIDVSVEGCLLETPVALDEGAQVRLTLECQESRRIFSGVVCRSTGGEQTTVAVRFTAIPLELRLATRHASLVDALDAAGAVS